MDGAIAGAQLSGRRVGTVGPGRRASFLAYSALFTLGAFAVLAASAAAAPSVSILSPSEGASINSGTVPLSLDVQNFTLNGSAVGMAAVTDEGHYHLMLDGAYAKFDYTTSTFLSDVAEGPHTVLVELANNDHSFLGINATVNITVLAGAPRLRILAPASSQSWASSSAELQIWKENFTYNPAAVGQSPVAGEGHYHVFVNGAYFYFGTTEFFNATYLAVGSLNTIRVELFNNDHSALGDRTFDEVSLTVPDGVAEIKLDPTLFQARVNASSLKAALTVSNFTFDGAAIGQTSAAGRGHYHAWLDGVLIGPSVANPLRLSDLTVGEHTLLVELRNNNHSPLATRVVDWEIFTVLASAPRVTITSPFDPATVNATSLDLQIAVGNFTLDGSKMGQANVAGQGHWHVAVDGALMLMGGSTTISLLDLTAGPHIIEVSLANHDHSDLAWPVFDIVRVVVLGGAPHLTLDSPGEGSSVALNWTAITVTVANFTLAPDKIGQPPVTGEGHWHVLVDGTYVGASGTLTGLAPDLSAGTHTIRVQLANNDHSALGSPVFDEVTVTVVGARASIAITSPAEGAVIYGNSTTIGVLVTNFTMAPGKIGQPPVNGEGHWHLLVDGVFSGAIATASAPVTGLAPGHHVLTVELHNNDHSALLVGVSASVSVHVAGIPAIRILTPVAGFETTNRTISVSVELANFTLIALGAATTNAPGEGHLHVIVDGVEVAMTASASFTVPNLTVGAHTIRVVLANNDHTAFTAGQNASQVSVTVKGAPAPAPPSGGFLPGFGPAAAMAAFASVALAALAMRRRRQL